MKKMRPVHIGRASLVGLPIFIVAVFGQTTIHAQTVAAQAKPMVAAAVSPAPAAGPTPTVDVEAAASPADSVRLTVGRSTLIDVGSPIARVSLTSADIADALVTSPSQLLVHGKVPGAISLFVWSRGGAVRRYEVAVQRDVTRLSAQIKELFPTEKIDVQSNGRSVILSGTVSNKDVIERVVNVATASVEKKEDVTSVLQVQAARSNQVVLRVRFAEVSRSAMTEFGLSFFTGPNGIKNTVGRVTTQQFPAPNFEDLAWKKAVGAPYPSNPTESSGKISFSDFLNLFLLSERFDLGVVLKAMQNKGLFQSLAEPNLVAESGKEASFLAGGEFPVPVVTGTGNNQSISIQYKEFGVRLNFTPTVNGDRVHLKVKPEVSSLDYGNAVVMNGFRIPALSTRRTETELELRDGQTFAISGLMNNQISSTMQKIPGLGDIPIIGQLFRSKAAQKDQTELVVMITPHILPTDSVGVTGQLPRLAEPYLAPLSERSTTPAPPAAFTPERRSSISEGPAAERATVERAAADQARIESERNAVKQAQKNAAAAPKAAAVTADTKKSAEDERKRQEKLAAEQARLDAEAAQDAEKAAKVAAEDAKKADKAAAKAKKESDRLAEADRKAQDKRDKEQAEAAAKAEAEAAKKAGRQVAQGNTQ